MPLMLLTALAIRIDSPGKVLFRQRRTGLNGGEFDLLKFRSMVEDAESKSGPTWAREDDPRITRVGRVIRTLRIDELPQLINILKGEMSFVGPRPERPVFVKQLEERIPYYGLRHAIRPGLTGWAQVQYAYSSSVEETEEKLRYDLFYVKNSSILLDMWIVLKTIKVVLQGSGSR
jgi:lipopolysaccharide/colanic/teichoic acid biosynthesis glycosyltransferase